VRAIIIGAGIGGATAAIALRHVGIQTQVFERAPAPGEVGAGITIWGNAVHALRTIGADEPVIAAGAVLQYGELRTARGRILKATDVGAADRALGMPSILLHRADLLDALLGQLPPDVVRFGRRFVGFRQDPEGVTAFFDDNTRERGDILIGADGINSTVRTGLLGSAPPRYSGYTCWRGVAHLPADTVADGYVCEYWGRGARFGIVHIGAAKDGGGGRRIYWYATRNAPPGGRDASPEAAKAALISAYGDWCDPIPAVIAATDPAAILRNDIIDRPPTRLWTRGRVALLGDAAHATTPNIGQGACMAIEDAAVLAQCLTTVGEEAAPEAALAAYAYLRYSRTARITRFSWWLGRVAQMESAALCALRDRVFAAMPIGMILRDHRKTVGYRV
jgi:2-polyprenyl-6-methoxyphenol hydroxylase-like FAD-dependent oxidoreductase